MMLTFIFDYTWAFMLVIAYVIWSVRSIRDIIHTKREFGDSFDTCFLEDCTLTWIAVTLLGIFGVSFIHYLLGGPLG